MNIEDLAMPPDPERSAEIDRRIIEGALRSVGINSLPGHATSENSVPTPIADYAAENWQKTKDKIFTDGVTKGAEAALQLLEQHDQEEAVRRLKLFVEALKEI